MFPKFGIYFVPKNKTRLVKIDQVKLNLIKLDFVTRGWNRLLQYHGIQFILLMLNAGNFFLTNIRKKRAHDSQNQL